MKKTLSIFLAFAGISSSLFSQSSLTEKDVFSTKKIIFYGYDYSHFHLADAKRYGQDLKVYIFKLIGSTQERIQEQQLKKWLGKDSVIFNFDQTTTLNKKIINDDIVVTLKTRIPEDSLQIYLNRYTLSEKSGIGNVILFECFDDLSGSFSAYSVFFDISTKKILLSNWALLSKLGHMNNFNELTGPTVEMIEYLEDEVYKEKQKKSLGPK